MTRPRHTADTITDDALDRLHEELDRLAAAVERAEKLATKWAVLRAYGGAAYELRAALDGPTETRP